ncbi:hypothetical protein LCGC14_0995250 [marine sediment metagenome]|uniref:Uncharacterized protein n=1 Tax=marine sediment metagenome TaxID=412755 RepID=A0A0F9NR14_9ZZZZ
MTHLSLTTPYWLDCLCKSCKEVRRNEGITICDCGFLLIDASNKQVGELTECPRCKKLYSKGSE